MVNIISDYIPPFSPLPNIAPFTYKDGETYLSTLDNLRTYVNTTLVTFTNENFALLNDSTVTEINTLIAQVNSELASQDTDVANAVSDVNIALANNIASVTALTTSVNQQLTNLQESVNIAVTQITTSSIEAQDPVVAAIVNNGTSATRIALNAIFSPTAINDSSIADNISNPASSTHAALSSVVTAFIGSPTNENAIANFILTDGTLVKIALDGAYAQQEIEDIVTSGRLSTTNLNTLISTAISNIDYDNIVATKITTTGSAIKVALDSNYSPIIPANKYRKHRPFFTNMASGIGGIVDGKYYFDGVSILGQITIQFPNPVTSPVGTAPTISLPSKAEVTNSEYDGIGTGMYHSATSGSVYPAALLKIFAGNDKAQFKYNSGTAFADVTATLPFTWGLLDGITFHYRYIPLLKKAPNNFAAYGDSITRYDIASSGGTVITWPQYVADTDSLCFAGGYAVDSATSAIVLAGAASNMNADVGVTMVGVNDIATSVAQATTLANIVSLRNKINTSKFLLCKIAPYNGNPTAANSLNVALAALASSNGWGICDPYAAYRQGDGTWTGGSSGDGTHPVLSVQQAGAVVIKAAINTLLSS